jgi:hypothetical protein
VLKTLCHIDPCHQSELIRVLQRSADPKCYPALAECVPICLDLMAEAHAKPADRYKPVIATILSDRCRLPMTDPKHQAEHERQVELLVTELEKLRVQLCRQGKWSEVACPPQMFG